MSIVRRITAYLSLNTIMSKVILTETDYRDWQWSKLFAKALTSATHMDWNPEDWVTGKDYWHLGFVSPQYHLVLDFDGGNVGYVLVSYTLSEHGDDKDGKVVKKVFANNKDLIQSVKETMATFEEANSGRQSQDEQDQYIIAAGLQYEDADFKTPSGYRYWQPIPYDEKEMGPQFAVIYQQIQLKSDQDALAKMDQLETAIKRTWMDGYYPPKLSAYNLTRGYIVSKSSGKSTAGILGQNPKSHKTILLNDELCKQMGIKMPARKVLGSLTDTGGPEENDMGAGINEMMSPSDSSRTLWAKVQKFFSE